MHKIRTKFLLIISGFLVLFSAFLIFLNSRSNFNHLYELIRLQTELALEFDLAIRDYVAEEIRPFAEAHSAKDEFIPETMSTSFIARNVFDKVRKQFPDYIIKFSSDDPRNPANQADLDELKMINWFNEHPETQRWNGRILLNDNNYFAYFSARRMGDSCLRCHGDPKDAPASLLQRYGNKAGFHRKPGTIIGLDTVAIPLAKYEAGIWGQSARNSLLIIAGLTVIIVGIFWVFNRLVSGRLAVISGHFREAARQTDFSAIELIKTKSKDEIGDMAESFNFLASKLRTVYETLEDMVNQKTLTLQQVNHDLQNEIEIRTATEKQLIQTQQKMVLHVEQTPLGVIEWDVNFRVIAWNPAAERIFGYSTRQAVGRHCLELIIPDSRKKQVNSIWQDLLKQKGGTQSTNENVTKDGRKIICKWYNTPLVDHSGRVIAVASLVQDITDQHEHEKQLLQAKREAESANKAKSEFLAKMSYEIRTPMNAIIGFTDILREEILVTQHKEYVNVIKNSGHHLLELINDILDFSKIEAGKLTIEREEISLELILSNLEMLLKHRAAQKGIDYRILRSDSLPATIIADPTRLQQCLINLVGNSIKFTEHGYVYVNVSEEQRANAAGIRFDIEDTGIGIPKQQQTEIFEAFNQGDAVIGQRYGGTGLGLTITRQLANLMGGCLELSSNPGKGSVFTLWLPLVEIPRHAESNV